MPEERNQQNDSQRTDYLQAMLKTFIDLFSDHTRRLARLEASLTRVGALDDGVDPRTKSRTSREHH
jgi:hypothetical protein